MYINSYLHYNFMELMPIVRNRLNSEENENESQNHNPSEQEIRNQIDIINNIQIDDDYPSKKIVYIYESSRMIHLALLHTFLLAVFETIFYWTYVTEEEKKALTKRLQDFRFFFDIICSNLNNVEKQTITDYLDSKAKNSKVDNEGPFNMSIILIVSLFFLSFVSNFINILIKNLINKYEIKFNKNIIGIISLSKIYFLEVWYSVPLFMFISVYEYLFFQSVIYYYQPISTYELINDLASDCIN